MPINVYQIRLREFERKNHTQLRSIHAKFLNEWIHYNVQYNYKIEIDYENFVKYCYSVSRFTVNRN